MKRTTSSGTKHMSVTPSTAVEISKCRSTSQYCIVSAWMRLLFVITRVVTDSTSDAVASRIPVRCACRLADAWRSIALCACEVAVET